MAEKKPMPVIKVGRFRDMDGDQVIYTLGDLEHIADSYNPDERKAPLFLESGWHESKDGDAAGWVQELFVEGEILYALVGDVPPEVKQAVADGRRRQVSAEIRHDQDGKAQSLKRVALLGSSVPAVPGLPSLDTAMFTEGRKTVRLTTNFEEEDDMAFFGKDKKQDGDKAPEKKAQTPPAPETPPAETPAAKPEPEAGSTASLTQGGDDKTVKLSQEVAELRVQNAALAAKMKTKEIQAFTDGLTKEGKLPPGLNTPALHAFMASLSEGDGEKVVKFTDGEGKPQAAGQLALFKDFLSALPVLVTKGHMFTSELAGNVQGEHPEDRAGDAIAKAGGLPA